MLLLVACSGSDRRAETSDRETAPYSEVLAGRALLDAGRAGEAEQHFLRLAEQHPESLLSWRGLQDAQLALRPVDSVIGAARGAVEARPEDSIAWYLLGRSLIKRPDEARPALERALELNPSNAWAAAGLAHLHYERGDTFGAVSVFEEAVLQAPRSSWLRLLLGNQYLELKLYVHAQRHLEIAGRLDPENLEIQAARGKVLIALRQEDGALELLESVLAAEPRIVHIYPSLADLYLDRGRVDEAQVLYRKGLESGLAVDEGLAGRIRAALILQRVRSSEDGSS